MMRMMTLASPMYLETVGVVAGRIMRMMKMKKARSMEVQIPLKRPAADQKEKNLSLRLRKAPRPNGAAREGQDLSQNLLNWVRKIWMSCLQQHLLQSTAQGKPRKPII